MRMKKIKNLWVVFGIILLFMAGCGSGVQTEEEIVIPRGEGGFAQEFMGDAGGSGQTVGEGIARQVQAPERYVWEGSNKNVLVKADAPVIIPQGEGFHAYKVTGRIFTRQDYERAGQVFLEGFSAEDFRENSLTGNVAVEGRGYLLEINNEFSEEWKWRWVNMNIMSLEYNGFFQRISAGQESEESLREEAGQKAIEAVAEMGFTEFIPGAGEYFRLIPQEEKAGKEKQPDGQKGRLVYSMHFIRTIDEIPVTYTYLDGSLLEEADSVAWPYESLELIYDKEGLVYFNWENPYELEQISREYVFLLPFSEIQSVFEEMMLKKYGDFFADADAEAEFQIREVRLGYMRVIEKGNPKEGEMIPVWDFFGSERIRYEELELPYVEEGMYNSWLTINATDGTIIDRGFGY